MSTTPRRYYARISSIDVPYGKYNSYGTVIYLPPDSSVDIDFGIERWPQPDNIKKQRCPRVLLVSTWMDNKFGFIGGAGEAGETPEQTMNREFHEEMGTTLHFSDEHDHVFSCVDGNRATHVYAKVTRDLDFFNSLIHNFYKEDRKAYLDEVLSLVALPIWIEGPPTENSTVDIKDEVWGLPRFLMSNSGIGCFTSGRFERAQDTVREQFLLLLLATNVLSPSMLTRVAKLSSASVFAQSVMKVKDFEELCSVDGVKEVVDRHMPSFRCECSSSMK